MDNNIYLFATEPNPNDIGLRSGVGGGAALAQPGVGALTLTAFAPTILTPQTRRPDVGSLTLAGLAPLAKVPQTRTPNVGALALAGFVPTIIIAPVGSAALATPGVGVLTLSAFAPTVVAGGAAEHYGMGGIMRPLKPRTFRRQQRAGFAPTVIVTQRQRPSAAPVVERPLTRPLMAPAVPFEIPAPWTPPEPWTPPVPAPAAPLEQTVAQTVAPSVDRPVVARADTGAMRWQGWSPTVLAGQSSPPWDDEADLEDILLLLAAE